MDGDHGFFPPMSGHPDGQIITYNL
jgi:hypothetical protein